MTCDESDARSKSAGNADRYTAPESLAHAPCHVDADLPQVTVGLAWHYKKYAHKQSEEDRARYSFAEVEAGGRRAGLWRDVALWDWKEWQRGRHVGRQRVS